MYLALYRKFRPTNFEEVVGQDHIVKTLKNQIKNNQIGHAYLFCGSRGTGKTSVAKIFARAVNCINNQDGSPCQKCDVCKSLLDQNNIDIIEIDAASNNRVDEVRDLRDKVKYPPVNGKYKVYIIDEVHMLTDSAFNALLKTLEEPPKHIIFILATTEPQKLPATILSRVLRFDFKLVGQEKLENLLKQVFAKTGIKAEVEAIKKIAKAGNGSVRDCFSIADMCASFSDNNIKYSDVLEVLGTSEQEVLMSLAKSVLNSDVIEFIKELNKQTNLGKNIISLYSDLTKEFRDILVLKANGISKEIVDLSEEEQNKLVLLAKEFDINKINKAFLAFSAIEADLKYSTNPQLLIEMVALSLAENIQSKQEQKLGGTSASKIWGQVLIALSEKNVIMHAACAEIENIKLEDDNFFVFVDNDSVLEMMKKSENYADLVACFEKLGYNYRVKIIKSEQKKQKQDKTKILSEKIGLSVEINKK